MFKESLPMGQYDEVVCEYPLPDGYDATGIVFQTKDLWCNLQRYTITAEGVLLGPYGQTFTGASGTIRLIYTNEVKSGGGPVAERLYVTVDGQPSCVWRYAFTFAHGQVIGASGGVEVQPGNLVSADEFRRKCGF